MDLTMHAANVQDAKLGAGFGPLKPRPAALRYTVATAAIVTAFLIRFFMAPILGDELPFMLFIAATLVAAWYGGLGPGVASLVLGILFGMYFITAPSGSAKLSEPVDALRIARYLVTTCLGIAVIEALHRSRRQVQIAAEQV